MMLWPHRQVNTTAHKAFDSRTDGYSYVGRVECLLSNSVPVLIQIILARRMEDVLHEAFEGGCPWKPATSRL